MVKARVAPKPLLFAAFRSLTDSGLGVIQVEYEAGISGQVSAYFMIKNRCLPQWLHRASCGVLGAVAAAAIASYGLRDLDADSWRCSACRVLLWLSVPVGIVFACAAHRFSIAEGCAGDAGYEDLD
jgi:hypothetical protein